jgi:hypothetical protein
MAIYDELLRLRSAPAQGKDASSNSLARLNCQHCHASLGRWTKYEDHELACEFCGRISEFNAAPPPGKDNRAEREKEALLGGALCLEATAPLTSQPANEQGRNKSGHQGRAASRTDSERGQVGARSHAAQLGREAVSRIDHKALTPGQKGAYKSWMAMRQRCKVASAVCRQDSYLRALGRFRRVP